MRTTVSVRHKTDEAQFPCLEFRYQNPSNGKKFKYQFVKFSTTDETQVSALMADGDATQPLPLVPPAIHPQLQTAQNSGHHLQLNEHETTLLVRHLPEAIPQETLSRLFSHYGASSVRPCSHGRSCL